MDKILTEKLRSLMAPGVGVLIPGTAHAFAARIAEGAGFEAVLLTGARLATTFWACQMYRP